MPEVDLVAERAFWEARGMAADFDRAMSPMTPPATPTAAAVPPSAAEQLGDFLPPNVAEAARAAVSDGHWTKEQAHAALEGFSKDAIDRALAGATAEPSEDMRALNSGGFRGAQSAAEIGPVGYDPATLAHLDPAAALRLDQGLKQAMIDAEVPASGAAPLIKLIADTAHKVRAMEPAERAAWEAQQKQILVGALGLDDAKAAHAFAAETFAKIRNTDLMANLLATGVLADAFVIWTLAQTQDIATLRQRVRGGESLASITNDLT
jgi:hypothetical protein